MGVRLNVDPYDPYDPSTNPGHNGQTLSSTTLGQMKQLTGIFDGGRARVMSRAGLGSRF